MKKLMMLVLAWICVLALAGCNNRSMDYIIANEPDIIGVVKDTNEKFIIIENENGEYCVSLNVENEDSMTHFNKGDEIVIYFDGNIAESYPMQINTVYAITLRTPADRTENNIDFQFEVGNVENVEMYHFVGVPVSAEKKVIVEEETIKSLYDMFKGLSLKNKQVEETAGADVTSFRFNLSDGTNYELIYICNGTKNGKLTSSTGNFEYFISADIGSYWSNIDIEAVPVEESELPK